VADTLVRTADGKAHRSHRVKIRGEAARELRLDLLRHPWVGSQDVRHQVAEHHTRVAVHSVRIQHPRLPRSHHTISRSFHTEMQKLRIVTIEFGTGRQKMVLERWTNPKLSRRTCTCEYGLQSCRGKSVGAAKRPRERSPTRNPSRYDSQLLHVSHHAHRPHSQQSQPRAYDHPRRSLYESCTTVQTELTVFTRSVPWCPSGSSRN
jgi:hypothetical protein